MIKVIDAILSINPSAGVQVYDNSLDRISWDEGTSKIPKEDIQAEMGRLEKEYDAQAYARARKSLYPDIGDQLDMQYWDQLNGTTTWKDAIAKVKSDNPKP